MFHDWVVYNRFFSPASQKAQTLSILPLVDLVLFDIKHLDPERHKRYTGVDNNRILANAEKISARTATWFRIPLIAEVNDDPDHVAAVADLAARLGVEKISLLPYHEGGLPKWPQIGEPAPDSCHQ